MRSPSAPAGRARTPLGSPSAARPTIPVIRRRRPRSRLPVISDSRRYGRPSAGAGLGVEQLLREDGGLADVGAAGGGEQGQRLVLRQLAQVLQRSGPSGIVEFGPVAAAELGEPVRIVGIPAAQGSGWGDLLAPFVQVSLILGQAARPEAVDQHPGAVLGSALVVDAADPYAGLLLHAGASLVRRRWDPEDGRGLRLPVRPGAAQAAALVLPDQFGRRRQVIAHADRPGRVLNRVRGASSPPRSSRPTSRTPGRPRQPRWPVSEPRVPRSPRPRPWGPIAASRPPIEGRTPNLAARPRRRTGRSPDPRPGTGVGALAMPFARDH